MERREGPKHTVGIQAIPLLVIDLDDGQALGTLLKEPGFHVSSARSFEEGALALRERRIRAVVVGLASPSAQDMLGLRQLARGAQDAAILVVSRAVDEDQAVQLIKTGVQGYLFSDDLRHLARGVRELLRGGVPMSAPVSRLVLQRARRSSATMAAVKPSSPAAQQLLSERQLEILKLLQRGHSYEDIGVALGLSVNTVRSHMRALYERLGASTKVEAVMIGMELGLLEKTRLA